MKRLIMVAAAAVVLSQVVIVITVAVGARQPWWGTDTEAICLGAWAIVATWFARAYFRQSALTDRTLKLAEAISADRWAHAMAVVGHGVAILAMSVPGHDDLLWIQCECGWSTSSRTVTTLEYVNNVVDQHLAP